MPDTRTLPIRTRGLRSAVAVLVTAVGVLTGLTVPAGPAAAAPAGPAAGTTAGPAVAAGLSPRVCRNVNTGDNTEQLSICAGVWFSGTGQWRGVVDLHTYRLSGGARVGDAVSQSITLNIALLEPSGQPSTPYGIYYGSNTCRLNGPGGQLNSCTVAGTAATTFYGRVWTGSAPAVTNCVYAASWRDGRGVAHYADHRDSTSPDQLPLCNQYCEVCRSAHQDPLPAPPVGTSALARSAPAAERRTR